MDRLVELCWARDDIKARILDCRSNRDAATLHTRYIAVLNEIESVHRAMPKAEGSALDEVAERRKASRRPDASASAVAARNPHRR